MRLNGINYRFSDGYLSGLQFSFSCNEVSDKIQTDSEKEKNLSWEYVEIDPRDILTRVEANLDGDNICCIKFN